jgi:hypothetical protein
MPAPPPSPSPGSDAPDASASNGTPIRITFGETVLTARLYDNATARDLAAQLPLTLTFRDLNNVEKTAPLPRELSLDGAPEGDDPTVGDIGYWAPDGDLVLYYGDVGFWNGIVRIGEFDGDMNAIERQSKDISVTIDRAGRLTVAGRRSDQAYGLAGPNTTRCDERAFVLRFPTAERRSALAVVEGLSEAPAHTTRRGRRRMRARGVKRALHSEEDLARDLKVFLDGSPMAALMATRFAMWVVVASTSPASFLGFGSTLSSRRTIARLIWPRGSGISHRP